MKWKSLFAAALTAAVALPALAQDNTGGGSPSLSFSFANNRDGSKLSVVDGTSVTADTEIGVEPVPANKWIELFDLDAGQGAIDNTETISASDEHAYNFTLANDVTVTYSAKNAWSVDAVADQAASGIQPFLQTYLDDGNNGASILVKNVPFTKYDVIVYLATDTASAKFLPVFVNGVKYKGTSAGAEIVTGNDTWGSSRQDYATLGTNALKVSGLETQTLTIRGSVGSGSGKTRCGIAAFQIIQASDGAIRDTVTYQPVISVNMKGNVDSIVGTSGFSGLNPILNTYWNELPTSGTSESGVGFMDDSGLATSLAIDATYSGAQWSFSSAGRPTLGDMANGYREVTTLDLAAVPYSQYDLILYYASDLDGTGSNTPKPWAPVKITSGETVSYYTYTEDHATGAALKVDETDAADWGTTASCKDTEQSVAYGGAVMLIEDLTGDITLEMLKNDNNRDGLYGFQIVCTGDVIVPPPPSISVNVIGGNKPNNSTWTALTSIKDTEGQSGLADYRVDNANWNELTQQNSGNTGGTPETLEAPVDNTGAPTFATVTARLGGWWNLTSAATVRTNAVGYMGVGFCDPSKVEGTNELTLANVPYTEYSLILYYGTNNTGHTWAAPKVTLADGTVKTYTYAADATGAATEGTDAWGSTSDTTSEQAGTLGKDVMLIKGLSGDISIDLGTQPNEGAATQAGSLCGFQIVCTGEVITVDPAKEGVISLNFNSGTNNSAIPATETKYGLVAVPGSKWQNLTGTSNADGVAITTALNTDLARAPSVTFSSTGGYQYNADQTTCPYLRAYLDDDGNEKVTGVDVDVANVPYRAYDVVVYFGMGDANNTFRPVAINGTYYRWDDAVGATVPTEASGAAFGTSAQVEADYGVNAIRVKAQTGNLDLDAQPRNPSAHSERGGIAALQLVERKVIEVTGTGFDLTDALAAYDNDTPVLITFAEGATVTGNVTLPDDAVVDLTAYTFGETAPFSGTLTLAGGTIRLPAGFDSAKIAASISGSFTCFIGDELVWLSNQDGTLSLSYEWWGLGGNDLWSNPLNWSSGRVPNENAEVSFNLGASDETVILDEAATVASVTITGPASGTAASLAIQAQEGGSLTVSGQMLTTGNVTVTQSANITVQGETKVEVINEAYGIRGATQAGFHVHQGTWQIRSGTLSMPTEGGANTGEAGISGNGTLIVGGEGASNATLAVRQIRTVYYNKDTGLANGTLRVATDGTLTASSSVQLPQQNYTTELAGGTIETPTLITFAGATVSADSSLRAPTGRTATVRTQSRTNDALTGTGGVTLSGTVTIASELAGYTGTLTVSAGSALTLSNDARPRLVLEDNASLTVTPTPNEIANTSIVFPTSMTTKPENVTYTVNDVTKAITVTVDDNEDTLTLSWEADYPTLSTSGDWSTGSWKTSAGTTNAPSEGSAILDGTGEGGIEVTLDTDLSEMTSIFVKGNVTLVTKGTQFTTIPACVALTEEGTTLTVDADFSGAWTLPAGTTLQVTQGFTSFANLTLEGAVVILVGASGTDGTPTEIEAPRPVEFNGGLTIAASNLTLESVYNVGKNLELAGDNITIAGNSLFTDNGTEVVNTGTDNVITGMTGLNGSLAVEGGTLALTLGASPTNTFSGATIAEDATLTLAGPDNAQGWWFPATGAGTLVLEGDYRPLFSAVTVGETSATDIPAKMILSATADEQDKGLVSFQTYTGTSGEVTIPDGFVAEVKPYDEAPVWVPVCVRRNSSYIDIYNVPAPNGVAGLEEAVALALRQAAAKEGITNGNYTVQLRTKGGQTTIASPDAAALNDVLGCFTGLTASADGTTLTYAYDFGITGIKRTAEGWVVTAKVQGENAAQAGFAKGNAYALTVKVPGETGSERIVNVTTVDDANIGSGTVELTVPDEALQDLGDEPFTLGVSVSRNAQQL